MIRAFPRQTSATPVDENVRIGGPHLWDNGDGQDVLISCAFTRDKGRSEQLCEQWRAAGFNPQLGGPAYGDPGVEFTPGMFVKKGLTITSRGCNNNCWFCTVSQREGPLRELTIEDGHEILDNNLLQCGRGHVTQVFNMLSRQKKAARFTGGLEANILKRWHVELIDELKPKPQVLYFAYDTPNDREPLINAASWMQTIGFNHQRVGCYVLMGYPGDTITSALERIQLCINLDIQPFAMLWEGHKTTVAKEWKDIQNVYTRPARCKRRHKGQFGRFFR